MDRFGAVIRRFIMKLADAGRRFMHGRYGTDKLNTAILVVGVICCVLAMLIPALGAILTLLSYVLMGWAIFRMLSRNTYQRYQENRKYLRFLERIKDREHKYFDCPRCRQPVRVPRGKGKISITCPKCGEKFIKKS
jgi:multisubunit Na+/H+ antiporter MnhG subunit